MIVLSFKSKRDKEHLLDKARKMEEYAAMIVDCIEESTASDNEYDFSERAYKGEPEYEEKLAGRYGYRRRMR